MCCRGVQGIANPAYLGGFLFSCLLRVAPYCVPGGIRVVSNGRLQYGRDPRSMPGTMPLTSAKRVLRRAKYHPPMGRHALRLGLVVTLAVLALSACGGGGSAQGQAKAQEEAKARPLPEDPQALRPGEYRSGSTSPRFPSRSARAGRRLT